MNHGTNLFRKAYVVLWASMSAVTAVVSAGDPEIPFEHICVDENPPERPYFKMVGDIDGDGDLDIIVAGAKGPLVWYAAPRWNKTRIADGEWAIL